MGAISSSGMQGTSMQTAHDFAASIVKGSAGKVKMLHRAQPIKSETWKMRQKEENAIDHIKKRTAKTVRFFLIYAEIQANML